MLMLLAESLADDVTWKVIGGLAVAMGALHTYFKINDRLNRQPRLVRSSNEQCLSVCNYDNTADVKRWTELRESLECLRDSVQALERNSQTQLEVSRTRYDVTAVQNTERHNALLSGQATILQRIEKAGG